MDCVPIDQPDPYYGSTPLAWASKYDSSHDAVRYLVEKGAFVNNKGQDGNTPLIWACDNKATKNADYLIKNCANTTLPNLNGDTPLSIVQKSLNKTGTPVNGVPPLTIAQTQHRFNIDNFSNQFHER